MDARVDENIIPLLYEVSLFLNGALPQSPADISKTQKAIDYIKHFGIIGRFNAGPQQAGTHHITLVLTNNNLSETCQWKVRLGNKMQQLNTLILSSGKDSSVKNLDQLWGRLLRLKKADDLPDLLVMCTHEKRVDDVIDIIKTLKNKRYDFRDIGIHRFTLSIMFDEADKNIKLIVEFLKSVWPLLTMEDIKKDDTIRDIHFITATALDEFWKMLKKAGVYKLKNINHAIQNMNEDSVLHTDYKELMRQYRSLKDHTLNHTINDVTDNPIQYARKVIQTWGRHSPDTPRIVFAPADIACYTHYEMCELFRSIGYWVYIDNSEKNKGKMFYHPTTGAYISLEKFRKTHNITGELYDVFRKWRELYPTESLAITGWLNIIRGITFNTTGFNFTNMILSTVHAKSLGDLIQVAGRANGDTKFVNPFEIHIPESVWKFLQERIDIMNELYEKNPTEFEEKDFRPKTARDEMEVAWTVPRVFHVGEEAYAQIKSVGNKKEWDVNTIFPLITDGELVTLLRERTSAGGKFQITQPKPEESPDTYKKYVTDFIVKAEQGRIFNMGLHKKDKKRDGFQIFLDKRGFNIIVSVYNGSKIKIDLE